MKNATLKEYPDFPHGMCTANPDEINADLLAFFQGSQKASASCGSPRVAAKKWGQRRTRNLERYIFAQKPGLLSAVPPVAPYGPL